MNIKTESFLKTSWDMLSKPARVGIGVLVAHFMVSLIYAAIWIANGGPQWMFGTLHPIQTALVLAILLTATYKDYKIRQRYIYESIFQPKDGVKNY